MASGDHKYQFLVGNRYVEIMATSYIEARLRLMNRLPFNSILEKTQTITFIKRVY